MRRVSVVVDRTIDSAPLRSWTALAISFFSLFLGFSIWMWKYFDVIDAPVPVPTFAQKWFGSWLLVLVALVVALLWARFFSLARPWIYVCVAIPLLPFPPTLFPTLMWLVVPAVAERVTGRPLRRQLIAFTGATLFCVLVPVLGYLNKKY